MDHMLAASFANRLNSICVLPVVAVDSSAEIDNVSKVYICARTLVFSFSASRLELIRHEYEEPTYNPSINELFFSALPLTSRVSLSAFLLTGIGDDGAKGLLALRQQGVHTVAESKESAIVYGMPRSAHEMDAAVEILNLHEIISRISGIGSV